MKGLTLVHKMLRIAILGLVLSLGFVACWCGAAGPPRPPPKAAPKQTALSLLSQSQYAGSLWCAADGDYLTLRSQNFA